MSEMRASGQENQTKWRKDKKKSSMTRKSSTHWRSANYLAPSELTVLDVLCLLAANLIQRLFKEEQRERLYLKEREARAKAERTNRIKDDLLATVSHELRTSLTAVLGWGHFLKTGDLTDTDRAAAIAGIGL
jgi:signal transduction histidine kinase